MTRLGGQIALVTGGNRGLGREFVRQLLDRGAARVYAAARDPRPIVAGDPWLIPMHFDATDPAQVARAAGIAQDVSVVVNNTAGIAHVGSVPTPTPPVCVSDWRPTCSARSP
ncbi:SDR family NAD(P)-dependent oxidoreductase [Streptomyces sp. ID05-04B]|uniref:SDR family NAD(P)-dependent oxidoreductase n=1 Tax=Streptomyces brasiliscabiei TaxID=2736302 RepID=A0ABU8GM05_9ACTN|nr:SDR family NAD(P)-dependent oxidoreductase [Streptomyces sp. ID05-04B]MDX5567132.1 SDR family NAD(P)-dependent oxidoreductase [Streptomyces sp. ID05-04B]